MLTFSLRVGLTSTVLLRNGWLLLFYGRSGDFFFYLRVGSSSDRAYLHYFGIGSVSGWVFTFASRVRVDPTI